MRPPGDLSLFKNTRKWHDVTRQKILRYIGLLFYMGRHIEPDRESYWKNSALGHNLGRTGISIVSVVGELGWN
jgi:hypothetical protein